MIAGIGRKHWFALIVLLTMSAHYAYFRVPFIANDYGRNMVDWPLLGDLLVTFPLLFYFMFRPSWKAFLLKWLVFAMAGFAFGSLIIPDGSKDLWRGIERLWPLLAVAQGALELFLLVYMVRRIKTLMRLSGNADEALASAIHGRFADTGFAPFALFEARIWYYGLFMRRGEQLRFAGQQHFSYDKNDGNVSNQFALIMVMLFEMPLSHLMLHLVAMRPVFAWVVDVLSVWSVLYLVAEYRASQWRPVSLDEKAILIRYGVFASDRAVPYHLIESVTRCSNDIRRQRGLLRYRQFGSMNVELRLKPGSKLLNAFGRAQPVERICISLDKPDAFIDAVRARLAKSG
ncbi:hypothetical protein RugamoR64_43800 [Duganella rhizosphaerae]|uniref:hypothetical protein n=1 Tax=Duganella rhizosphaerae TaxID=2885763 RepID=UPI0030E82690